MDNSLIFEIAKWLTGIILGGGASWVLFFRRKRQQMINKMASDDYEEYSDNLSDFMERLTAMSKQIDGLLTTNQKLHADNVKLANELARIYEKCTCGIAHKK